MSDSSTTPATMTGNPFLAVFIGLWIILGIISAVMSILCAFKGDGIGKKILGIIIAFFLGPVYILYYFIAKDQMGYCRDTVYIKS